MKRLALLLTLVCLGCEPGKQPPPAPALDAGVTADAGKEGLQQDVGGYPLWWWIVIMNNNVIMQSD
jgi:hypothetical protein